MSAGACAEGGIAQPHADTTGNSLAPLCQENFSETYTKGVLFKGKKLGFNFYPDFITDIEG